MRRLPFHRFACTLVLVLAAAAAADGQSVWGPETQVSATGGYSGGSVGRGLAIDSAGRLHVVWTEWSGSQYDVYYARSTDDGLTWSTALDLSAGPLPATGGNIAVGPGDVLHAAWTDRREGGPPRVYYSRSTDGGVTWETPRNIGGTPDMDAATPSICVDSQNRVHVAWHIGDPDGDGPAAEVYYTRSANGGTGFAAPRRLSALTGQHAAWPRFSVEGTSGDIVAVTWRDHRYAPDWDVALALSSNGGASFSELVGAQVSWQWDPDVIVDSAGAIHLAYMTYRPSGVTIDVRTSRDLGLTWSGETTVSPPDARFPFWVPDHARGVVWLFWKDETGGGANIAARYTTDGANTWAPVEAVTALGDIEVKFPSPAVGPDGRPHIVWSDQRYGSARETVFHSARASVPTTGGTGLPGAPSGLAASVSGAQVTLTWDAPATGGGVVQYIVEAGSAPGLSDRARAGVGAATQIVVQNVAAATYYVRVRAENGTGQGPPSGEIAVTVP